MYGNRYDKVQVGKIDLDTVAVAYLFGVGRKDEVVVLKNCQAVEEDLASPRILCIEVGGSGRITEGNFDHHNVPVIPAGMGTIYSACRQAWAVHHCHYCGGVVGDPERLPYVAWGPFLGTACENGENKRVARLVEYIDCLDTLGPEALSRWAGRNNFPTLSDVFDGMLLVTRDPIEQLLLGVEILQEVVKHGLDGINPYGRMPVEEIPQWAKWVEAKVENNRKIAEAVKLAHWSTTASGYKLAWLKTDFFGAPGALYGVGAQVVVAFSPHFGPNRIPKFTVAGNGIRVDGILSELNAREPGWGGPATGTILGSPREGSKLTLNEVIEIVEVL